MAAQDILPLKVWAAGALNNSIPANDNAVRVEVLTGKSLGVLSAQPATSEDGDQYVLGAAPAGAQWTGLAKDTLVIYKGGTWLAFTPYLGMLKSIGAEAFRYAGPVDGWQGFNGYVLPAATADQRGGVKVGSGLSVTADGVLSAAGGAASPITTEGDLLVGGPGGAPDRLGIGAAGQVLKVSADGKLEWGGSSGGGGGGELPELAEGDMLYAGPGGVLQVIGAGSTGMVLKLAGKSPYWGYPETKVALPIACSDESTPLTTGLKVTFRMPHAMLFTSVRASLTTAQASGAALTVSVNVGGSSAGSLVFANGEKSVAVGPGVVSSADDAEVTVTISQVGASGATGLKVYLIGKVTTT